MDEDQIDRYEAFRRSSLQKASMRKVIACALSVHVACAQRVCVSDDCACIFCSLGPNTPGIASVSHALNAVYIALESTRQDILGFQMASGGAAASQRDGPAAAGAPAGGHLRHHQAVRGGCH